MSHSFMFIEKAEEAKQMEDQEMMFDAALTGHIGVERECVAVIDGEVVPMGTSMLEYVKQKYGEHELPCDLELSDCQFETQTHPWSSIEDLRAELCAQDELMKEVDRHLEIQRLYTGLAPFDMPLSVHTGPNGRYADMARDMEEAELRFACRALATHVHIGMPSADAALFVYNCVIKRCDSLCRIGNLSSRDGDSRIDQYKRYKDWQPSAYASWAAFEAEIANEFKGDTSNNHAFIRITKHGTIEFRMFDSTSSVSTICRWAALCQRWCLEALNDYNKECKRIAS